MAIRNYRDLDVWQKALRLTVGVYRLTRGFPNDERFGLTAQLRRAASSVMATIAEGHERRSRAEFRSYVSTARGSVNEVENHLLLAEALEYSRPADHRPLLDLCEDVSRMLSRLHTSLAARRVGQERRVP